MSECKYFKGKDAAKIVDVSVNIHCLVSVENSNHQGDPLTNKPRRTPDGRGFITDVGIKNKTRRTMEALFGDQMYIAVDSVLAEQVDHALGPEPQVKVAKKTGKGKEKEAAEGGEEEKAEKKDRTEERNRVRAALCEKYTDFRLYGGALMDPYNFAIRGAVQSSFAMSIDPVDVMFVKLTRVAVQTRKEKDGADGRPKDTMMGDKPVIRFGLFTFEIRVNPIQAQLTGCTWGDIDKMVDALQIMWSHTASANRMGIEFERIDIFTHSKRFSAPAGRIKRAIHIERNARSEEPTSILDYDVRVDAVPGVEHQCILLVPEVAGLKAV